MATPIFPKKQNGAETFRTGLIRAVNKTLYFICRRKVLLTAISCWILFQVVYVCLYHYTELVSDPGNYVYLAQECIKHGTMYPDYSNYHSEYIHNPGWINIIILWLKIFGSPQSLPALSIAMNLAIVFLLFKVAGKVTGNERVAYVVVYLFMLIPANSSVALHARSEIPFEFFSLLSFYWVFSKRYAGIIGAGVAIALAQWIRPLAIAWMIAALFFMLYKAKRYKAAAVYVLSVAAVLGVIAANSTRFFPQPIFQASTSGVNFIMGANDWATGDYCGKARRDPKGLGYLPGLRDTSRTIPVKALADSGYGHPYSNRYTYKECDSIYMARGKEWVKEHPARWMLLTVKKALLLWNGVDHQFYTFNKAHKDDIALKLLNGYGKGMSLLFRLLVVIMFLGLFTPWWKRRELTYCLIPIVLCTGATILFCACRIYNFIMLPLMLTFASYALRYFYLKWACHTKQQTA